MLPWCSPAVLYAGSALALRRFRYQCILVKRYKPRCEVPLVSYQLLLVIQVSSFSIPVIEISKYRYCDGNRTNFVCLLISSGILVCFIAGMYLDWRNLALLGAALPIPFMILMFVIPETPRWYISKGKTKRARKSLQWLRGKGTDITDELSSVQKLHTESERNVSQGAFMQLFKKNHLKPLFISLGLMFFQQFSGINAVIFYTVQIFRVSFCSLLFILFFAYSRRD